MRKIRVCINDNSNEDVQYYKGVVALIYDDVYFIKCYFSNHYEYIAMEKEGIKNVRPRQS